MKYITLLLTATMLGFVTFPVFSQLVVKTDIEAYYDKLPSPPTTLAAAYQFAYANETGDPDGNPYCQSAFESLERDVVEGQNFLRQFYQQYPTGIAPKPQKSQNRVSAEDKNAMNAATAELAQKMLHDKEFAQQFAKMTEAEQRAYITKAMADKGIQPANGKPNVQEPPLPGTDRNWLEICNDYNLSMSVSNPWEKQLLLQQKYAEQHQAVNAWVETEIKNLPLLSFGEYGHSQDPEKVKAIKKQGLDKHRTVADAMMREAAKLLVDLRQAARLRAIPLNMALKSVRFGDSYTFGDGYTVVLQAQMMMLGELQSLLTNEKNIINEVARSEFEWRNFDKF